MIKTINELKTATVEELLKCYNEAQGYIKEFQQKFETDYSYGMIGRELQSRGLMFGWYNPNEKSAKKAVEVVEVKMSKDNACMNLNMTSECREMYKKFLEDKGYAFIHTTAALTSYMKAYKAKTIEVKAIM